MQYAPTTVDTVDFPIARKPAIGGEKELYVSAELASSLGQFELKTSASGTWSPDDVVTIPAGGADLQVKMETQLDATAQVVITVTGKDTSGATLVGTATFVRPGYASNRDYGFQEGIAVDVLTAGNAKFGPGQLYLSAANGTKRNVCSVWMLPTEASWVKIGCAEEADIKVGIHPAHPIACGLDGSAYVVKGRSEPSSCTVRAKHKGLVDGLQRFNGKYCCLRLDTKKAGVITTESQVMANAVLAVNPNFGDGNDEVKDAGEGIFEDYFGFYAP